MQDKTIHIHCTHVQDSFICRKAVLTNPAFGHRFSSTSHYRSSLAINLAKDLFACLNHPWQSSADIFRHQAFIVCCMAGCLSTSMRTRIPLFLSAYSLLRNGGQGGRKCDTILGCKPLSDLKRTVKRHILPRNYKIFWILPHLAQVLFYFFLDVAECSKLQSNFQ